jgi:hypothetical protein
MPRDCGSRGGDAPSSKMLSVAGPCATTWCCHQKAAPGPIRKLERFPPSRHATVPPGRATLYTAQVLRAETSRSPSGASAIELTWK